MLPINFYKLEQTKRECYICSKPMYIHQFLFGFHNKAQRKRFTCEELCEIWTNPIYIIPCCECFYGDYYPLEEIKRLANIIKERKNATEKSGLISW